MIESAYLIVTKFDCLYRQFARLPNARRNRAYAIPVLDTNPESAAVRYAGLDRNPLTAIRRSAVRTEIRMAEIEEEFDGCFGELILNPHDLADMFHLIELERPGQYEPVWARLTSSSDAPPSSFSSVGFEPSNFPNGAFSALCDCMCFPRWHGVDRDGTLFSQFFKLLNHSGLFETGEAAELFLDYYLSFEWTEHLEYDIIEVFMVEPGSCWMNGLGMGMR